jgi:hypothetical protein
MKLKISKKAFEEYKDKEFFFVSAIGINNMTSKSRDIILKLKKVSDAKGVKSPNLNPFVNYLTSFALESSSECYPFDLSFLYGDLHLDFLESEMYFLELGGKSVISCGKEYAIFDSHSVAHRFSKEIQGERVKVSTSSDSVGALFCFGEKNSDGTKQLLDEFAKIGRGCLGVFGRSLM